MSVQTDIRRNPFTGAFSFRVMDPEVRTIAEFAQLPGIFGFQLQDKPKPSTVSVVENVTGGQVFTEVTVAPLALQFRVDLVAGLIQFNVADDTTETVVNYEGGGSNTSLENLGALVNNQAQIDSNTGRIAAIEEPPTLATAEVIADDDEFLFKNTSNPYGTGLTGVISKGTFLEVKDKLQAVDAGWVSANETWTFLADDAPTFTITVPSDATTKYSPGMRVRLSDSGTQQFLIHAVADTILTLYGGTDFSLSGGPITVPFFSSDDSPFDFPKEPVKWTEEFTDSSSSTIDASPTTGVVDNPSGHQLSIPIGSWKLRYSIGLDLSSDGGGLLAVQATFGITAATSDNVTATDTIAQPSTRLADTCDRVFDLTVASKTTFFLNAIPIFGGTISIWSTRGAQTLTYIRALSAYL